MAVTLALHPALEAACGRESATPRLPKSCRVRSAEELRKALRTGRENPLTLDASGLDRVLRLDAARGTVEVQAATTWSSLAAYLEPQRIPLHPFVDSLGLPPTVGAAVEENAPGPDGVPLSRHVVAITYATPEGELRRADRGVQAEHFRLALGGHGAGGVLYSVTLRLDSLARSAQAARAPVQLLIADGGTLPSQRLTADYLLPPERLEEFLAGVRSLCAERRHALRAVSVTRLAPEDETFLRWARREWAGVRLEFAVRATLGAAVHAAELRRLLLALALDCGGSFPLRDAHAATREQLERCYPMLGAFLAEKRRADPMDRLQNAWSRCIRARLRGETCEVRWDAAPQAWGRPFA